ncbi:MAG TPA: amino acid ABC transporter substrate-binding protein [Desulfarculaceae bacterium]|nr:amino acid ABC transporter substrate-binding protein [Desulfarculaceae bacterium]
MLKIKLDKRNFLLLLFFLSTMIPASVMAAEISAANNHRTARAQGSQIAVILPLSGPFTDYGEALKRGYELGFAKFQTYGTVSAAKYRVEYLDSEGDPEVAKTLINLIASEGDVVIASGTPLNATAWTASRACEENSLPYLIVGADQDNLINNESFFSFRLTQKSSGLKNMLATFIKAQEPEIKTMGIIYGNSPCAINQARQLQKLCIAKGIDLAIWEKWKEFSHNRDNFYDLLNIIKERRPQVLFLATDQKIANRLWLQGRRLNIMPAATISIPTNCITALPEPDRNLTPADQLPYATPWITPERTLSGDETISPRLDYITAQGAAAAKVIVNCLQKSLSLSTEAIVKSMESTLIDTVYGQVKFTQGPSGHQNQLPWYLSSNDGKNQGKVIFPATR